MTAGQWLTNIVCPLIVGIILIAVGVTASPLSRWFWKVMETPRKRIADATFSLWWSITRLFMSKKQRKEEDKIIEHFQSAIDRLQAAGHPHRASQKANPEKANMPENELTQGKTWIENTLRSIAAEFGVKIDEMKWSYTGDIESLNYVIDGKLLIEKFSEENLEDCPNHNIVKRSLEKRLRKMIMSACSSTPKIGIVR